MNMTHEQIASIPIEMRGSIRWLCHQAKRPTTVGGLGASVTNPLDWSGFSACLNACNDEAYRPQDGVGYVFNGDGIVGIDIDNCCQINPVSNEREIRSTPFLVAVCKAFKGTYTEVSLSGKGLHIYCKVNPAASHLLAKGRKEMSPMGMSVEYYPKGRYFVVTGDAVNWSKPVLVDKTRAVEGLIGSLDLMAAVSDFKGEYTHEI